MELRQLRYFLKAGELLNFTAAARAVNISQSTLSQQVRQLEEELGTPLFDRVGKRVLLTEAGRQFAVYARQTVRSASDGLQILRDLAEVKTGELVIGVTYALHDLMTATLVSFSTTYPGIIVKVLFGTSEELLEKLETAELDFLLTFQEEELKGDFTGQLLFESRMALVVSAAVRVTDRSSLPLAAVRDLPLALPVTGYNTRRFLDEAFAREGIRPRVQVEINDIPTLFDLVRTGQFHTILTLATTNGQHGIKAIPIEGAEMYRKAWVVWLNSSYHKKAATLFCALLLEKAGAAAGAAP
ncbi:LysR substrate-binding domain-containing protein [Paraflavisolibacter sp. H34]|uniref:LysR substrate-binding domain-containing protein n=1 Tax=Huijunlia imazamoxiresistens TaxID=3127457 RepID=UPI00301908E6